MAAKISFSNQQVAELLKSVAAALSIKKKNPFQIKAYENAASSIEHSTTDIQDLWEEGKLDEVPGVGENMQKYLDELFKTGHIQHFDSIVNDIPKAVFEFINIPGIGPKTAQDLAALGIKDIASLEKMIANGELLEKGVSEKLMEKIKMGIAEYSSLGSRMLLPFAAEQAEKIIEYLKKGPGVKQVDPLGSLRRRVVTIGDLDFAASTSKPQELLDYFTKIPGVAQVVEKGSNKAMIVLKSGLHVDLLVGPPESYGALLQHFTGGKNHNIRLRTYALKKDLSLSEDGIKHTKTGKVVPAKTEEEFYKLLGMQTPSPEIREDNGEIDLAIKHELPDLIPYDSIKGDFHLHSNYSLEPSHGPGANSLEEIIKKAVSLGYKYIGLSDHSPGFTTHSKEQITKLVENRTKEIKKLKSKYNIRVLNGLEIDILPDGTLSVPDGVLKTLDYCIAGVHSVHKMEKDKMTERILKALSNPYVDILAHPTGRILNQRGSYEADWPRIFKFCKDNKKILEINAFPNRLDLRDDLIKEAISYGVTFVIDTDAHEISQMDNMPYGISVARRGWVEEEMVLNTWEWKKVAKWFSIG